MEAGPRSGCPINLTLEILGDRWSLIVIRDVMFGNRRHYGDLLAHSEEHIASNVLADRLKRLVAAGLLSKRDKNPDRNGADIVNSEVILTNIRVLAIDQAPKEKDGTNALIGKTVTLELKPEQTETLARARQSGVLSLALRSIADNNAPETRTDDNRQRRGETINVIRFGVANQATMQK